MINRLLTRFYFEKSNVYASPILFGILYSFRYFCATSSNLLNRLAISENALPRFARKDTPLLGVWFHLFLYVPS